MAHKKQHICHLAFNKNVEFLMLVIEAKSGNEVRWKTEGPQILQQFME